MGYVCRMKRTPSSHIVLPQRLRERIAVYMTASGTPTLSEAVRVLVSEALAARESTNARRPTPAEVPDV